MLLDVIKIKLQHWEYITTDVKIDMWPFISPITKILSLDE